MAGHHATKRLSMHSNHLRFVLGLYETVDRLPILQHVRDRGWASAGSVAPVVEHKHAEVVFQVELAPGVVEIQETLVVACVPIAENHHFVHFALAVLATQNQTKLDQFAVVHLNEFLHNLHVFLQVIVQELFVVFLHIGKGAYKLRSHKLL